jgi:diaminohydroxyphosphoribosylaminopyrimidine deaminase/5-amino-6-(5-phosphoribosylamino)uracil reductase
LDEVDEIVSYTAGLVLGDDAVSAVSGQEIEALQLAPRFRLVDTARVGPDVRSRWRRAG